MFSLNMGSFVLLSSLDDVHHNATLLVFPCWSVVKCFMPKAAHTFYVFTNSNTVRNVHFSLNAWSQEEKGWFWLFQLYSFSLIYYSKYNYIISFLLLLLEILPFILDFGWCHFRHYKLFIIQIWTCFVSRPITVSKYLILACICCTSISCPSII